jgi:hypothetical protein
MLVLIYLVPLTQQACLTQQARLAQQACITQQARLAQQACITQQACLTALRLCDGADPNL